MALPTRRQPRRALTASAVKLDARESAYSKRLTMPKQHRALEDYHQIPELHFVCHFPARMMSRVRYFPATLDDNGKITEITEGEPVERLNKIQDPGGGRSQMQDP